MLKLEIMKNQNKIQHHMRNKWLNSIKDMFI